MGEKFTSRVGFLIRNFRIAAEMTQKELADTCGLNESTIRNYELGNRYPDEATLLNIANNLGVSFYALSDPDVANIFSALHVLFDIEWAYGLRPTMKDGEVCFKFEERLPSAGPRPQEDLDNFRKMVEYWASLRDKLEYNELFIQPSRYEGFGLTVAEAIAAKVPVLVSNIEGPLEIIDGGRLGMSFENKMVKDCAEKIKQFILNGRNDKQVEDAYQYVKSHYDVSVTARKYIEVYKSILKE